MALAVALSGWIRSMAGVTFRGLERLPRDGQVVGALVGREEAVRWLTVGDHQGRTEWLEVHVVSPWQVLSGIGAVTSAGARGSFGWIKAFRRARSGAGGALTPSGSGPRR